MLRRIFSTLQALWHRDAWESGLDAELRLHLDLRAADLVRSGLTTEQARRQARIEFGSVERYKEETRRAVWISWMEDLRQDLVYTARTLRRSPGFALTAILSMALGIGANTVVFGILNTVLFRELPVEAADRLWFVDHSGSPNSSYPGYEDLRDNSKLAEGVAGYQMARVALGDGQGAEPYWGFLTTRDYFDVLGVKPAAGRFYHAGDEHGLNSAPFVVISYELWQSRFHGDRSIVGREIRVNTRPYTLLGVAPRDFFGTEAVIEPKLWIPIVMSPQITGRTRLDQRGSLFLWVVARAKAGVSQRALQSEFNAIADEMARLYPMANLEQNLRLTRPGMVGSLLRGPAEQFSIALMGLAGLVLLASCVNLAALMGARAADRGRELALRLSVGAGRGRVLRQLLTESVALTIFAGGIGCALAWLSLTTLSLWRPLTHLPLRIDVSPDLGVMLFALTIAIATGMLAGVAPARHAWRLDANEILKGSQNAGKRRWPFRELSLLPQTALCCLIVLCSIVAVRGFRNVITARPGLNADGVSVVQFDPVLATYTREQAQTFQRRALDAVVELPGVTSAALSSSLPLEGDQNGTRIFKVDGPSRDPKGGIQVAVYAVSPGYFRTMGTRLLAGREYQWNEPNPAVGIINAALARRFFGTEDAVGKQFRYFSGDPVEVIGVVEDGKYFSFSEDPRPVIFQPFGMSGTTETSLIARSSRAEASVAAEMAGAVRGVDSAMPIYRTNSLRETIQLAVLPAEIASVALGIFGLLALMLAVTGIYGLASYSVSRRVREIGVRMAIGAKPGQVLRSVMGRLAVIVVVGSAIGVALGLASAEVLAAVVYQATPRDPLTLLGVSAVMLTVAVLSALGPIRRAITIDPMRALKSE